MTRYRQVEAALKTINDLAYTHLSEPTPITRDALWCAMDDVTALLDSSASSAGPGGRE